MKTVQTNSELPETLAEAIVYFADQQRAHDFMVLLRWPDGDVKCPGCSSDAVYFLAKQCRFKCRACKRQFSTKVGTVFEDSPLPLSKWLPCVWLIVNAKNGVSSCEVARALGVTQKTAWFMLQRIRLAMQTGSFKIGGNVEVDETFIGGRARLMNTKQRKARVNKTGQWHLTPVQGLLERSETGKASRVILKHVDHADKANLDPNVRHYVLKGSTVNTDQARAYEDLEGDFTHKVINHAECYVKGTVHTNGLENFWSLLKRAIRGTYVSVEPFHLFRYLDEQAFRFNERKNDKGDMGRFLLGMAGIIGKRLTYAKLIGKAEGGDCLPAAVV